MATNEILKFGDDASNILGQSAYAADTDRTEGVSGKARSNLQNKFQRQMSVAAAGLSQFIADYNSGAVNVVDTLSAVEYAALLLDALSNAPLTTQPQFDNTEKAATTAFVQRALGNLSGTVSYGVNTNLTAANVGKTIVPSSAGLAFGLPLVAGLPNGTQIRFNGNGHGCAISRQGSNVINNGTSGSITTISLLEYDAVEFTVINGVWTVTSGNIQLNTSSQFAQSLASNGYKRLPGGLIEQWVFGSTVSGVYSGPYPIPFPNAILSGSVCEAEASGWTSSSFTQYGFYDLRGSLATLNVQSRLQSGSSTTLNSSNFIAIVKGY